MFVRNVLQDIRNDYESSDTLFLMFCLRSMGVNSEEVAQMDRVEIIDRLMAMEEHAAFH